MNTKTLLLISFFASIAITTIGALLKILHEVGSEPFLIAGITASLIFMAISIYEVVSSKLITTLEKLIWVAGLLCFYFITGILYLFSERDRIVMPSHFKNAGIKHPY